MALTRQPETDVLLESDGQDSIEQSGVPRVRRVLFGGLAVAGVLAVAVGSGHEFAANFRAPAAGKFNFRASVQLDGMPHGAENDEVKVGAWATCTVGLDNCNVTKCCEAPGAQCYQQDDSYAQCRSSCAPGPDPSHWDGHWWTCQEFGTRPKGESKCSEPGQDCMSSKCCTEVGTQCFEKNDDWATCKSECIAGGPDMSDLNGDPWTCNKLGPWTPGAAWWVQDQCAADGEDCSKKECCKSAGSTCYRQNEYWAQCKPSCTPGKDPAQPWAPEWSCDTVGSKTPPAPMGTAGKVGPWVQKECSNGVEDCSSSKCCLGVDTQCYKKDGNFAMCLQDCTAGRHLDDNNETWSCKPLGPRSHGLALKGSPSLFCFSLIMTTTYEIDVIKYAMSKGAGIFSCDEYAVLSTDKETVIGTYEGDVVKTLHVPPAPITRSVDGTAGNAKLFINVWDVVVKDGRWRNHAWILKVDPDAVMVADRVRTHMAPHFGEKVYVVNCNKFPNSPNFPMMYGALEVFSFKAIDTYSRNKGMCFTDMGMMLPMWGEDYFMTHCLDHIGVGRIADFGVLGDWNCLGNDCSNQWIASFHPFKGVQEWAQCLNATLR